MSDLFTHDYACVIGVGADLPNTEKDAMGLADILKDPSRCAYPQEQVHLLTSKSATRVGILATLDRLAQLTNFQSTVIIYFSGHGYRVSGSTGESFYLMPFGYDQNRLEETAITSAEFMARLQAIPAQKLALLLDCCHAGGIGETKTVGQQLTKAPLPLEVQQILAKGSGRVCIASSRADELSYAGRPYSAFTAALIEGLCGKGASKSDGYVRWLDLAMHTREVVPRLTQGKQHPIADLDEGGADNFKLAYYAGGNVQPKGLPFGEMEIEPEPGEFNRQITNIGRDYIGGDQTGGDKITVGNVSGTGIAIGRSAQATVSIVHQLQATDDPVAKRLSYLVERLKSVIQSQTSGLGIEEKDMALETLDNISKLGRDHQQLDAQKKAKTALFTLSGILSQSSGLDKTQTENSIQGIREIFSS